MQLEALRMSMGWEGCTRLVEALRLRTGWAGCTTSVWALRGSESYSMAPGSRPDSYVDFAGWDAAVC
jgi:hypothetical protein